ncbi:MAG TPA: nuclear transport factor 2 family protein [Terriglobales bacterium]|nr:nuclear transport factor 2 family protein [Terriglobales bacterium]
MNEGVWLVAVVSVVAAIFGTAGTAQAEDGETIIAMERAALDRWGNGDPDGFLEISDPQVVYFDPFLERRLNGREELRKLYDEIRGKIKVDRYEMLDPKVQVAGDMAVLTFNFVSHGSEGEMRWNTTEVYQRKEGKWRIVHTHWSLTQPKLAQ